MSTIMVEVVKIDEETGKSHSYHIPIPRSGKELAPLTLKS
ncbi:unnamed protein product, partial [marine sediment metagenome]